MDPYATAWFNDYKSTACVEGGRRLGRVSCVPLTCSAPYVQSNDSASSCSDSECCADPYATACSSALVSTKCRRGYRTVGGKCVKS
ncbi:BQ2448_7288 [Microbotryum intermedium]|uniref:BQ2448_7288 protein n=1 Tax=Microbotryum intermedium TaxID=269621 RepID=A0A238FHT3_9BASI|nr:BQ2448_7288 [Microbotryum intermedium]